MYIIYQKCYTFVYFVYSLMQLLNQIKRYKLNRIGLRIERRSTVCGRDSIGSFAKAGENRK